MVNTKIILTKQLTSQIRRNASAITTRKSLISSILSQVLLQSLLRQFLDAPHDDVVEICCSFDALITFHRPNEVHAELRRPQLAGQWYSKSPEQWEELSHLHKLIYSHVGRIEETDLGEEVDPCEACRKRGFKCMKYKQDHPEVEKLYKGNVRVGTSCTRCRRYRRTCAPPGYKKPNGSISTPNRPQSNGYPIAPGTGDSGYKAQGADGINTWEDTLLAAASGGSPLTSVASTPEYEQPPPVETLPPPVHQHQPIAPAHHPAPVVVQHHIPHSHSHLHAHPQHRPLPQPGFTPHDLEDVSQHVNKVAFLDKVHMVENELNELRATQADFNKERRHWQDEKRDLQSEIYHLREDQRKTREENWSLQTKIVQLEKDALVGKGVDMDRIMAEAELKVENRQLKARLEALEKEARETKVKMKELKRAKKGLQRKLDGGGNVVAVVPTSSTSNGKAIEVDSSMPSSDPVPQHNARTSNNDVP